MTTSNQEDAIFASEIWRWVIRVVGMIVIMLVIFMGGCPYYDVWKQGMAGEAVLNKARQVRDITIEQARAESEAAELRANAISVVGAAATQYPEYRRQEFLGSLGEALTNCNVDQILYLPTEAMIPITEAGKR